MLFDDLLKKAAGREDSEPFQDLIEKAIKMGDGAAPFKGLKAAAGKKPSAPIKMPSGSPSKAGKKTGIQLDSSTQPVKKMVTTPEGGTQQKTYHEGGVEAPSLPTVGKKVTAKQPATKTSVPKVTNTVEQPKPAAEESGAVQEAKQFQKERQAETQLPDNPQEGTQHPIVAKNPQLMALAEKLKAHGPDSGVDNIDADVKEFAGFLAQDDAKASKLLNAYHQKIRANQQAGIKTKWTPERKALWDYMYQSAGTVPPYKAAAAQNIEQPPMKAEQKEGVEAPALYVPMGEPAEIEVPGQKKTNEPQLSDVQHVQHPEGGTVVAGHADGTTPMSVELDHAGKFYHDRIKPGDVIKYNAFSQTHGWVPMESKVLEKNPSGHQFLHVEHPNKEMRAKGIPLQVHYNKIHQILQEDEDNPGTHKVLKYSGEKEYPDATSPKKAKPQPKFSPKQAHQFLGDLDKVMKLKADTVKKHIKPGDFVEFWMQDPASGKLKLEQGKVMTFPTMQDSNTGQKGGQKGGKNQQAGQQQKAEPTSLIAYTKNGPVEMDFHHIHRFGKHVVDDHHFFKFDPKSGQWRNEGVMPLSKDEEQAGLAISQNFEQPKEAAEMPAQAVQQQAQSNLMSTPSAAPKTDGATPAPAQGIQDGVQNSVEHHELPTEPHGTSEEQRAHMILDAGGKFEAEDENGNVWFSDPKTGDIHSLHTDDLTEEAIREKLGTAKPKEPKHEHFTEQEPEFDIRSHWTHRLGEKSVANIRSMIEKLDQKRKSETVPASVLAARHALLHKTDHLVAMQNAATIHQYLQNPAALGKVKPTPTIEDFRKKFYNPDLESVNHATVMEKLGTNKPATPYLQKQQNDAFQKLQKTAMGLGFGDIADKLGNIDANKDNRQVLHFYKEMIRDRAAQNGMKHDPIDANIPSDEHIALASHLNQLHDYIGKQNLDNPWASRLGKQLNFLLDSDPNNPMVNKLFNQLHTYAYDQGENHPMQKLYSTIHPVLLNPPKGTDPKVLHWLEGQLELANNGAMQPQAILERAIQVMNDNGIKAQMPPDMPITRSDGMKQKIDGFIQLRKQMADDQQHAAQMKEAQKPAQGPATPDQIQDNGEQATIPDNAELEKKAKVYNEARHFLKNRDEAYAKFVEAANENPHSVHQGVMDATRESVERAYQEYKAIRGELEKMGANLAPEYEPQFMKVQHQKDTEQDKQLTETHQKQENHMRRWLASELMHARTAISTVRNHFLSRATSKLPEVQQQIKQLDEMVQQNLNNNEWNPINPDQFEHPLVQAFARQVNTHIQDIRDREKLLGIPLSQAVKMEDELLGKSFAEIVSAEKTLARRDISLALRKAFYNDVQSPELLKATNLLGSYFDDFIDAVMNTYTALPIAVRKSITRKLLKSVIADVVRDNVYSATTMQEDFTAPLNEQVIKSMGQEVAGLVTEFRMETTDKPFLVVNLSKGNYQPRDVKPFETIHRPISPNVRFEQWEWFNLLRGLEADMFKANIIETKVSEHRIRKFVADNDHKSLESFYNSNVNQLLERLAEIKQWA